MRALRFLRALLPSWRFFDRTTPPPRLFVRHAVATQAVADPAAAATSGSPATSGSHATSDAPATSDAHATSTPHATSTSHASDTPATRAWSPWRPLDALAPPRTAWTPLFAPSANVHLAYHAAVAQLVDELGSLDLEGEPPADGIERDPRVTNLVAYELVTRIARAHAPVGSLVQWKIMVAGETSPYIMSPELAPMGEPADLRRRRGVV